MRRGARVLRAAAEELLLPVAYARLAWRARSWSYAKAVLGAEEPTWNRAVYRACRDLGVRFPDLPVRAVELYAQGGEDLIVQSLLEAEALRRGVDLRQERYLEIGGNHPVAGSITFLLAKQLGMSGVLVEANPDLISDLERGRPHDVVVHGAIQTDDVDTVELWVPRFSEVASLDPGFISSWGGGWAGAPKPVRVPALRSWDVVRDHLDGRAPVFLSIDVEGMDLPLLMDFDFQRYRPWIVQAEPSDDYIPGSTDEMVQYLRAQGYELVGKTSVNLLFKDTRT
jgi:hypothetical protein